MFDTSLAFGRPASGISAVVSPIVGADIAEDTAKITIAVVDNSSFFMDSPIVYPF